MSRERVNAICATFPGAEVSDPWGGGHDAWKVGGKMFASIGAILPGVSVKTDSIEMAEMLIEAGVGIKAPYFHRSWINLPWDMPEQELRQRLAQSYKLVRSGLPKKTQAALARLNGRIKLHFLPPYSPNHNPIERVWWDVHEHVTRNHRHPNMDGLMRAVQHYPRLYDEVGVQAASTSRLAA